MSGYELYQDDKRVVIITQGSDNTKTGDMDQIWILAKDQSPVEAVRTGLDEIICGKCPMRAPLGRGFKGRACYVNVAFGPNTVWRAWKDDAYPKLPLSQYADVFTDRAVRFGAYGDPVHIPIGIVRWIVFFAKKHTGYTHQWQNPQYAAYREYLMASVETPEASASAHLAGWRTFRVRRAEEPLEAGEITCPASDEAGWKTQCIRCGLCGGSRKVAKNVAIIAHGSGARNLIQIGGRTTGDPSTRLCKLVWAQNELRRVADNITPDVAPQVAKRVRSLLKSVDGAIRNAERFAKEEGLPK